MDYCRLSLNTGFEMRAFMLSNDTYYPSLSHSVGLMDKRVWHLSSSQRKPLPMNNAKEYIKLQVL